MLSLLIALLATPDTTIVSSPWELRVAVSKAVPGSVIRIAPGEYPGGFFFTSVHGSSGKPILITAQDPAKRPVLKGGVQFGGASYLELSHLHFAETTGNGLNIDDGGAISKPANDIVLKSLSVRDLTGPGSQGIKMAGVDKFRIEDCRVERWGGCAIDMVGCHFGMIERCIFQSGGAIGIQAKGASSDIQIRTCEFIDYGERGVNIGGSTGIPFFRPALSTIPAGSRYESKNLLVEGNVFLRGTAPVAFPGTDGAIVRYNTMVDPAKWALRILQETSTPDFVPSRNGVFERNLIVFKSERWAEGGVNVGPGAAPETFRFSDNWWFCADQPSRSAPRLPTPEKGGVVGKDPLVSLNSEGVVTLAPGSPASAFGHLARRK